MDKWLQKKISKNYSFCEKVKLENIYNARQRGCIILLGLSHMDLINHLCLTFILISLFKQVLEYFSKQDNETCLILF